jgi:outer membrane cobalamin receptor
MRTALTARRLFAAHATLRASRRALGLAALGSLTFFFAPPGARAQERASSLDGLVVTASPTPREAAAVARHVTVLDGAELRALGLVSAVDALRDVAGVDVVRGGTFGAVTTVFTRGGESDYTLVMVDGVQVNQAGGGFDLASISLDNVERIEIVRGPASALYGSDAVSGVIHVITRTG